MKNFLNFGYSVYLSFLAFGLGRDILAFSVVLKLFKLYSDKALPSQKKIQSIIHTMSILFPSISYKEYER